MNRDEFMLYIQDNFDISGESFRLIANILQFASTISNEADRYHFLCDMLEGTIGLSDREIRQIDL